MLVEQRRLRVWIGHCAPPPDHDDELRISGASGITVDDQGNVYAADVGP